MCIDLSQHEPDLILPREQDRPAQYHRILKGTIW